MHRKQRLHAIRQQLANASLVKGSEQNTAYDNECKPSPPFVCRTCGTTLIIIDILIQPYATEGTTMLTLNLITYINLFVHSINRYDRLLSSAQWLTQFKLKITSSGRYQPDTLQHWRSQHPNLWSTWCACCKQNHPELNTSPIAHYQLPAVSYLNHC